MDKPEILIYPKIQEKKIKGHIDMARMSSVKMVPLLRSK